MIDAILKDLDQKPIVIKAAPPATRSRAFALWLALLVLYFLLLPTAAEMPGGGAGNWAGEAPAMSSAPELRHRASASHR